MPTDDTRRLLLRAAAVLAAVYLTIGLLVLVPDPAGSVARGATTAAAIVLAWLGALGVVLGRTRVAELGAVGLAVLGLWQDVAWVFMLPAGAVLAVAALVMAQARRGSDTPSDGGGGEVGEPPDGDASDGQREGDGGARDHEDGAGDAGA